MIPQEAMGSTTVTKQEDDKNGLSRIKMGYLGLEKRTFA